MGGSLGVFRGAIIGGGVANLALNRQWEFSAGDQHFKVGIPTQNEYGTTVEARGLSATYTLNAATTVSAFAGMAGAGFFSPNVISFAPMIPLGGLSIDHVSGSKQQLQVYMRALFSNQQSVMGGVMYHSRKLETGFAAGIGSNQPHIESMLQYLGKTVDIRSSYVYSGNRFLLLSLPQFQISQQDRENADVRWRPFKQAAISVARHEYLSPLSSGSTTKSAVSQAPSYTRSSSDMSGLSLQLGWLGMGASVFENKSSGNYASAATGFMAQRVGKRLHFNENYYRPLHSVRSTPTLSLVSEERLTRRVLFNQFATHANGQWNVNYGGSMQWDRLAIDVGYSTSFAPLAPGGGRFEQSMNVNGHLHLGRWMIGVRSYVQPDGRVGYAYDIRSYYYRPIAGGSVQAPVSITTGGLGNFLIAGEVRMEGAGKPVADVPIRIGDETVYTDNHGAFSLRVSRKHPYKIHPVLDRVIGFHFYDLVSGPEQVIPSTDDLPGQVQFVVRLNGKVAPIVSAGGMVVGEKISSSEGTGGSSQPDGSSAGPGNGKGTVPEKPATEQMPKENPSLAAIPQSSKSEAVVD